MADKEERICVTKYPYPCDVRCKIEGRYPKCMKTCIDLEEYTNSFPRQDAILRIARNICAYSWETLSEVAQKAYIKRAEAALNALLAEVEDAEH